MDQFNIENLAYTMPIAQKRSLMSCFPPFFHKTQIFCEWNVNQKQLTVEILKKPYANLHLMKFKTLVSYKGGSWPFLKCNNSKIISKRSRSNNAAVGVFIKGLRKMRSYKFWFFPIFNPPSLSKKFPFSSLGVKKNLLWGQ